MERCVVDRVPVDLPYIQVFLDLGYFICLNPVRDPPHALRRLRVRIRERLPVRPVNQRRHAARRLGRPTMVLAGLVERRGQFFWWSSSEKNKPVGVKTGQKKTGDLVFSRLSFTL